MSEIIKSKTPAVCNKCGSINVNCTGEYYTTGGDMEYGFFTHICMDCGHIQKETQSGCYGFDHEFICPMKHQ